MGDFKVNFEALMAAAARIMPLPGIREKPHLNITQGGGTPFLTENINGLATPAANLMNLPSAQRGFRTYGLTVLRCDDTSGAPVNDIRARVFFDQQSAIFAECAVGQTIRWERGADHLAVAASGGAGTEQWVLLWHLDRFTKSTAAPPEIVIPNTVFADGSMATNVLPVGVRQMDPVSALWNSTGVLLAPAATTMLEGTDNFDGNREAWVNLWTDDTAVNAVDINWNGVIIRRVTVGLNIHVPPIHIPSFYTQASPITCVLLNASTAAKKYHATIITRNLLTI